MGEYVLPKVKARYKYTRQNEDELQFDKGAIIQLITKDDGGWCEGKYNGQTGWFPSNYVREIRPKKNATKESLNEKPSMKESEQNREIQEEFYHKVIDNLVKTELTHIKQLQLLITSYLNPIKQNAIISQANCHVLMGNLEEILEFQTNVYKELEETSNLPETQQKVGQIFFKSSDDFEELFTTFCSNHHKAVQVILANKEVLQKFLDTTSNGESLGVLTSGLSKLFRRLDHYPALLREVLRHIKDQHPDHAYLIKAIASFEKISFICQELRKRKESEHHVLSSAISDWEGEPIESLGQVIYSSSAFCLIGNDEQKSRYLLLFPNVLLMLSTSSRMSSFKYEGKIPITALFVKKLDDCITYQHAFEISGAMLENFTVITKSAEEQRLWVHYLTTQCEVTHIKPTRVTEKVPITQIPPPPRHASPPNLLTATIPVKPRSASSPYIKDSNSFLEASCSSIKDKVWSQWCLRPSLLCRHIPFTNGSKDHATLERSRSPKHMSRKKKKTSKYEKKPQDTEEFVHIDKQLPDPARTEEERQLLMVIDMYSGLSNNKRQYAGHCMPSRNLHHSILDEKLIVEDPDNDTLIAEKSLIDTVYELKDQMNQLLQEHKKLRKQVEEESKARLHLEAIIRRAARGTPEPTLKKSSGSLSRKLTY